MGTSQWEQLDLFRNSLGKSAHTPGTQSPVLPPQLTDTGMTEAHRKRILGYLSMRLPEPVDLVFTNNRSTMISFRRDKGRLALRLHRLFRHADKVILDHLSNYIISPRKKDSLAIDRFIAHHQSEIERRRNAPAKTLVTQGRYYDLKKILNQINQTYFEGGVNVRIGWGTAPRRRSKRGRRRSYSRALATYYYHSQTIRVSPVLDAANVPEYVLEWIVYHEMLHHVLPIKTIGGRNIYHSKQFRALERAFRRYAEAKQWEKAHLDQLLF